MRILMALLVALSLSGAALAGGDAVVGKETFRKNCATCHGVDGDGNGPMAKALNLKPANLASKEIQALSDAEIEKVITKGKGNMKPVKDLTKVDIANLIAFIRSLAKK